MSTTSDLPGGPGVLQDTASRPAFLLSPHPSDEELAFDWTLSERDIAFILTNHRGPENLCRLAVQLCVLRKHGRFLANLYAGLSGRLGLPLSAARPRPARGTLGAGPREYRKRLSARHCAVPQVAPV